YAVNVYASADQTVGTGDLLMGTYRVKLSLKPGQTKGVKLKFLVPVGTPPGSYFLLAVLDADNALAESNETNNGASAGPLLV
ncbi:MAG TPA: CARDB domain-containing protein, partial [Humisphaera sp.]